MNIILHIVLDKVKDIAKIQLVLEPEHELETVLLSVRIPMRPVPVACVVRFVLDLPCWDAESNGLVRLSCDLHRSVSDTDGVIDARNAR